MAKGSSKSSSKGGGGGDKHPQLSIAGMVVVRAFLGTFLLYTAVRSMLTAGVFVQTLQGASGPGGMYVVGNQIPAMARFLSHVVAPHADLFGWLLMVGQALVGAMLLVGLLTRLAAIGGLVMQLFFLLATAHLATGMVAGERLGAHLAFMVMELAVLVSAAGRTWGIDSLIAKKTKWKVLW